MTRYSNVTELDKFYTPPETVEKFWNYLKNNYIEIIGQPGEKVFYEPAAGDGKFIDCLQNDNYIISGSDIKPDREDIKKLDFLREYVNLQNKIVFSNFPFGHQNVLNKEFLNRSIFLGASYVIMYAPLSFLSTYINTIDKDIIELIKMKSVSDNRFLVDDKDYFIKLYMGLFIFKNNKKRDLFDID